MKNIRNEKKGYSLLEIFAVIIILGNLVAFGATKWHKTVRQQKENLAVSQLLSVHAANENYKSFSKDDAYLQASIGSISVLSDELGLALIPSDDFTLNYNASSDNAYIARMIYRQGDPSSFTIRLDQENISDTNPCCSTSNCPSLDNCH